VGEEAFPVRRLALRRFCFRAQVGPRAADTFLRVGGEIVDSEST
jgi:hypothetical protein